MAKAINREKMNHNKPLGLLYFIFVHAKPKTFRLEWKDSRSFPSFNVDFRWVSILIPAGKKASAGLRAPLTIVSNSDKMPPTKQTVKLANEMKNQLTIATSQWFASIPYKAIGKNNHPKAL